MVIAATAGRRDALGYAEDADRDRAVQADVTVLAGRPEPATRAPVITAAQRIAGYDAARAAAVAAIALSGATRAAILAKERPAPRGR